MSWKKNPASSWKLYCVIDRNMLKEASIYKAAHYLYKSGADVIQLRLKNYPSQGFIRIAKTLQKIAAKRRKYLLINDRIDVALAAKAGGVHLGQGDMSPDTARFLLGSKPLIGNTVHSTVEARNLRMANIDYLSAGPIYFTPIKKHLRKHGAGFVKKIKSISSLPVFAIGGINTTNARKVISEGADGICVMRAIFKARNLRNIIEST